MKYLASIVFLFSSLFLIAQEFNYQRDFENILSRTKDTSDILYHKMLMSKYQNNDTSLTDFQMLALMINFTQDDHYTPYKILNNEFAIARLNDQNQYKEVIKLCDSLLETHPFNQAIIFEKAFAHRELKQDDSAAFYLYRFNQIMDAMAYSGKGTSSEDAIFSLGSRDSYNYIINRLSQKIQNIGSGQDNKGNLIDIIETADQNQKTHLLHFQIQHAVNKLLESEKGFDKQ